MTSVSKPCRANPIDCSVGRRSVTTCLLTTLLLPAGYALAAQSTPPVRKVAPFDTSTWAELMARGPRPAAYVFTTTYCSTCPEVFEQLHTTIVKSRKKVPLTAVVMDVPGDAALRHARHYKGITQMYAFDGFEPEIRQTVDPKWPNITPYVVLVGRDGLAQRCIGTPEADALKRWLA